MAGVERAWMTGPSSVVLSICRARDGGLGRVQLNGASPARAMGRRVMAEGYPASMLLRSLPPIR